MSAPTQTHFASPADILQVRRYRLTVTDSGTASDPTSAASGTRVGDRWQLERRLIDVGSSPDSDVVVEHPTVSRAHCQIEFDARGHRIRDLGSKNGVTVNGVRVVDAYLPPEAVLGIGGVSVRFELGSGTVEVPVSRAGRFGSLIGDSLQMREIFGLLAKVAPTPTTVLIEGESGTGKELIAEAVHQHSSRATGPFVIFDCSAVASELIESELFGHVRGAFTGAHADRLGAFQEASGGTLFIDEIGELALDLQPKLLRVLEKQEIKQVGSNKRVRTDARIVAATNRNLAKEVEAGTFREDLYYRLAVIRVDLPPLRKRREDIPGLVRHFIDRLGAGNPQAHITYETMAKLKAYNWPGNVRELRNYVERALLLSETGRLETGPLQPRRADADLLAGSGAADVDVTLPFKDAKARLIEQFERTYWTQLLGECTGNVSEAARRGGIHRKSLEYLLKKLDIRPRESR